MFGSDGEVPVLIDIDGNTSFCAQCHHSTSQLVLLKLAEHCEHVGGDDLEVLPLYKSLPQLASTGLEEVLVHGSRLLPLLLLIETEVAPRLQEKHRH